MTVRFKTEHTTALRSAVDLLSGCVSPEYAEQILGDYKHGGKRHKLAASLYALIDAIERNDTVYIDSLCNSLPSR
jgi:hypothetical protein